MEGEECVGGGEGRGEGGGQRRGKRGRRPCRAAASTPCDAPHTHITTTTRTRTRTTWGQRKGEVEGRKGSRPVDVPDEGRGRVGLECLGVDVRQGH
eukprot:2987004-Rhodomonas_salina.1